MATKQQIEKIVDEKVDAKVAAAKTDIITIEKRAWLDNQCKQYENNIKISGLQSPASSYYGKNASARREWRQDIIQRAFVDTNVMAEDVLFAKNANGKKELRRIVRDAHPLGNRDNATIVVAFTESWVANDIKETVRKGGNNLLLTKTKTRSQRTETIKINGHSVPILDCLRNEALKARRALISAGDGKKRYICNDSLKHPWVALYEIEGESKKQIPFVVEDGRLADPARTLAIYAINGGEFKPYRLLTEDEKKGIATNILTTVPAEGMAS